MSVISFFQIMFNNFVNLLSMPIRIGGDVNGDITISVFGVFIGCAVLSLVFAVIRRLYD